MILGILYALNYKTKNPNINITSVPDSMTRISADSLPASLLCRHFPFLRSKTALFE